MTCDPDYYVENDECKACASWDHQRGRVGHHVHSELRRQPVLGRGLVRGVPWDLDKLGRRRDVVHVPGEHIRGQV